MLLSGMSRLRELSLQVQSLHCPYSIPSHTTHKCTPLQALKTYICVSSKSRFHPAPPPLVEMTSLSPLATRRDSWLQSRTHALRRPFLRVPEGNLYPWGVVFAQGTHFPYVAGGYIFVIVTTVTFGFLCRRRNACVRDCAPLLLLT